AALAGGVFLPASLLGKAEHIRPDQSIQDRPSAVRGRASRQLPKPCHVEELGLTKRQGDVLKLLVQGLPNKSIATRLGISVPVIKKHVSDMLAHFNVVSRTQLVAYIAERGIYLGAPDLSDPRDEVEHEDK
ncbi:MAG: response regulator transcription factor, partial [Candidatus Methylumidiphilus sp.]